MQTVIVTPWPGPAAPTERAIRAVMDAQGLDYYKWENDPLDTYAAHIHTYNKIIYVAQGSITFSLPQTGQKLTLHPGDRLELPANTIHSATVSIEGVACLEAHL